MTRQALVACIGNIFLGDHGFGSAVARYLCGQQLPYAVRVVDYGIRGMHLAYEILEGDYDSLVLVDALSGDEQPGSLRVLHMENGDRPAIGKIDTHSMTPTAVLAFLDALGGTLPRTFIVGCQPATVDAGIGLSPPVSAAVRPAADKVRGLLARELDSPQRTVPSED